MWFACDCQEIFRPEDLLAAERFHLASSCAARAASMVSWVAIAMSTLSARESRTAASLCPIERVSRTAASRRFFFMGEIHLENANE